VLAQPAADATAPERFVHGHGGEPHDGHHGAVHVLLHGVAAVRAGQAPVQLLEPDRLHAAEQAA
jgi:hypothetical protein